MWAVIFGEQLLQDVRYGLRAMLANKLFSALAIISLALGIGANTAIYSFMNSILIRAIPVRQPEQLAILNWHSAKGAAAVVRDLDGSMYREPGSGQVSPCFPYRAYEFLRANTHVFSTLFGYADAGRLNLIINGQAELGQGQYVSGGYFSGLGVIPAVGRLIGPMDDSPGAAPVIDLAYNFWQQRFGGNANVVGKTVVINGKAFAIAGVTAPEFFGVLPQVAPALFVPIRNFGTLDLNPYVDAQSFFNSEYSYWIELMGRLRPGITLQRAQTETAAQFYQWVSRTAKTRNERATLPKVWLEEGKSGMDELRREYSKSLYTLMTMVALILAIACANLANLLLARAAARRREMAVRLSLGARRLRVVRQLLTESVLLSLCGGVCGILVAAAGVRALTLLLANGDPDFSLRADLDWRVLGFTLLITFGAGILFGIAPAIQSTRVDVTPALKETRAGSPGERKRRLGFRFGARHLLVVFQIAISLALVTAAGLFLRSLENLHSVDLGFNRENLLVFNVNAAQAGYKNAAVKNLYAELQDRFTAIPGVQSATVAESPLVSNSTHTTSATIPGLAQSQGKNVGTSVLWVGPGFFETMKIPIVSGRAIDARDRDGAPAVVVVNQIFAKKYFPGVSPIGRRFSLGDTRTGVDLEIVGIARTARYSSLKSEIPPVVYPCYLQRPKSVGVQRMFFELRTGGDPMSLVTSVRRIMHEVAPEVPVADVTTQSQIIDKTIVHERTFAGLCSCFGALALIMACVGLYATQAYAVTRRTGEIGIRMALGAERTGVIWMIVKEVLVLSAIGVVIGLAAVWQTTTVLQSFLFELKARDPATFEAAAVLLIACAVLAGYGPARRASRIDPMVALRHE